MLFVKLNDGRKYLIPKSWYTDTFSSLRAENAWTPYYMAWKFLRKYFMIKKKKHKENSCCDFDGIMQICLESVLHWPPQQSTEKLRVVQGKSTVPWFLDIWNNSTHPTSSYSYNLFIALVSSIIGQVECFLGSVLLRSTGAFNVFDAITRKVDKCLTETELYILMENSIMKQIF